MSREAVVAGRYAKALYEIAAQEGRTLEVEQEIRALVNAFNEDQDIQKFISTPNISEAAKWEVLEGALEGKMSKSVVSLVKLLVERGRIGILPELLDRYIKITGEVLGLATATVYTTYPLNEEEKAAIADEFGALVNKKIRVLNEIDKDLLGGMKVRIGDTLYDGSLAGKLERLEKSFRRQAL
ncbi:F0F1 ATP synthase subunit delta [Paenibacillus woosongensis]|uniref:ATP synthase subunit delta n=1 Tax=Paenibacillus woosongensis TaxID=307580 RepID=A0AA95IAC0_9BACL|nr:F0F1 ATP synthase subunit delta [Paenibacillus woosongensis]WHX48770.1 F0F1 ATP synthase subunit delta [Paenibacillus woosongensis]